MNDISGVLKGAHCAMVMVSTHILFSSAKSTKSVVFPSELQRHEDVSKGEDGEGRKEERRRPLTHKSFGCKR